MIRAAGADKVSEVKDWAMEKAGDFTAFDKTEWNLYAELRQKPSANTLKNAHEILGVDASPYLEGEFPHQWAILSGNLQACELAVNEQVAQFRKYAFKDEKQKLQELLKSGGKASRGEKSILDNRYRHPLTNEYSPNKELNFQDIVYLFFEKLIDPALRDSIDFDHETNLVDLSYKLADSPTDGLPQGVMIGSTLALAVVGLWWLSQAQQTLFRETGYLMAGLIPSVIDSEFPDYSEEFKEYLTALLTKEENTL